MKPVAIVSCLAALANAAVVNLDKRASPLDVKVEQVGNSEVKASITNTGKVGLKVLKTGSILDSAPVEKTKVFQGDNAAAFTGVRFYVHTADLKDNNFQVIDAGETVEVQWDTAQSHDLSAGGNYTINTTGSLRYAELGSNEISGQVIYNANPIHATVDGAKAAQVYSTFHQAQKAKRIVIQSDCTSSQKTTVNAALSVAQTRATKASTAAAAGTRVEQYFRTDSSSTRSTVSSVFDKVADVVASGTSGSGTLYCTDIGSWCTDGVVAYTQPGDDYIVVCPYWFQFPATDSTCHGADQPYVLIHEATHMTAVASTDDVCYGYEGCVDSISNSESLNNADSFALYSNGIQVSC